MKPLRIVTVVFWLVLGITMIALGHSDFHLWLGIGYLAFALATSIAGPSQDRRAREREERELEALEAHRDWLRRITGTHQS